MMAVVLRGSDIFVNRTVVADLFCSFTVVQTAIWLYISGFFAWLLFSFQL
jgi:hypothetical protein